ncbi:MAG: hypothetical protein KKC37_03865 [Proteobacteria bacterium]|nr:hypothetical protein [Pseudomonadota bacterium]
MGVQQCQVEDWLKIIRLRVGDDARVIVVSTYCQTGGRIARIDKPVFERDFGDLIAGFHEVDSLVDDERTGDKVGVAELKEKIARAAADLEQMGMEFNRDWKAARDELLKIERPRVEYTEFAEVCERHGLDEISTKTLAELMHDLGYIVYYADDERLQKDVVLQPEWLTKAVSFVLEDRATQEADGILSDARLKDVWLNHGREAQPVYGPELYRFFLGLMCKFDVSYRLEDGDASLIAQHVPQVQPDLPWLPNTEPRPGHRRLALACVMEEEPPGLMPWMIVRTHPYRVVQHDPDGKAHRLHWQKGVFLQKHPHGQALCEQRGREFHVHAEAVWPEFFMNVLRRTLTKLITDNWPGLEGRYNFAVPCPSVMDGKSCRGRFDVEALLDFLNQGVPKFPCQVCRKVHGIVDLLYGFERVDPADQLTRIETGIARYTEDDLAEVLTRIDKVDRRTEGLREIVTEGFEEVLKEVQEFRTLVEDYFWSMLRAVATESRHGPRLFGLEPGDGNWRRLTKKRWRLVLWCEAEGCRHPMTDEGQGVYNFDASRDWVVRVAPYANLLARGLKAATALAAPMLKEFLGDAAFKKLDIAHKLDIMKTGTAHLLQKEFEPDRPPRLSEGPLTEPERDGVLALHSLLRDLDPHHAKLGLKRLPTYTGDYVWLCPKHYEQAQSKIPDKFE